MNILIAYFSVGSAHKREADSLAEHLRAHYPKAQVRLLDFVSDFNIFHFQQLPNLYSFLTSHMVLSFLYDKAWRIGTTNESPFYKTFLQSGTSVLAKVIQEFQPDVAITTHAAAANILASYKVSDPSFALVPVLTDFGTGEFWPIKEIDFYITPSLKMKRFITHRKFPALKTFDYGLPLHPEYLKKRSRTKLMQKYGLNPRKKTIMGIMGGAAGTIYSRNIIKTLEILKKNASIAEPTQFLLTTGKNKVLLEKLQDLAAAPHHDFHTFGFLSDEAMADFMFLSDVIITKASGLNISEALAMNAPPILVGPFWGQERENAQFITAQKAGFVADQPEEATTFINQFFTSSQLRKQILKNVRFLARPRSTQTIAQLLIRTAQTQVQK